jgi:hypothetical protein
VSAGSIANKLTRFPIGLLRSGAGAIGTDYPAYFDYRMAVRHHVRQITDIGARGTTLSAGFYQVVQNTNDDPHNCEDYQDGHDYRGSFPASLSRILSAHVLSIGQRFSHSPKRYQPQ